MHIEALGSGPRLVLVHGSAAWGTATWSGQRPLAKHFRLEIVARPGFPPLPPVERVDFEQDAPLVAEHLGEGTHLVGHSYGGVVCLLAAALRPEAVRSLCVIEPPCFAVARGDPAVDEFVTGAERHWASGPRHEPRAFLAGFLAAVGVSMELPDPLPAKLEQSARMLVVERLPSEAEIPLSALRAAGFPTLVVSGGHHPAFDAVCDVLERELAAKRAVLPGAGHAVQRLGEPFNEVLEAFVARAREPGT